MSDNAKQHIAFIFCRGGSKGIPDKNIKLLAGKPLLVHAIECALESRYIKSVVVSTDSDKIAEVATAHRALVLNRPDELATDTSSELLAWRHAITAQGEQPDGLFISLPATSPLRAPQDIDAAIERYRKGDCDIVFGISQSHRNPYLNMVRIDGSGHIHVVNRSDAVRRQDVPDVYDITTCVYVSGIEYVMSCDNLMSGRVGYVEIPVERSLDIDEPYDFHVAELLMQHPFRSLDQENDDEG